jgi:hypothetical protein
MTRRTSLYAGAQYEDLGSFSQNTAGEQAQLNLEGTVNLLFGVQFSF